MTMTSSNCATAWGRFYAELASNDNISKAGTSTNKCMSGGQKVTTAGTDAEKLRQQANKILLEAAATGALDAALAKTRKSQAGKEDAEELRKQALKTLLAARKTGALEAALAKTKGGSVHAATLRQLAKQTLLQGAATGALDAALIKAKMSKASTEDAEELRQQVKQTFLEATKTGALEAALAKTKKSKRGAVYAEELRQEAKATLLEAQTSGALDAALAKIKNSKGGVLEAEELRQQAKAILLEATTAGTLDTALANLRKKPQESEAFRLLMDMEEDIRRLDHGKPKAEAVDPECKEPQDTSVRSLLEGMEEDIRQMANHMEKQTVQQEVASADVETEEAEAAGKQCVDDPEKESRDALIHSLLTSCFEDISALAGSIAEPKGESSLAPDRCSQIGHKEASEADVPDIHCLLKDMEKLLEDMGEPTGESSSSTPYAGRSARTTLSAAQAVVEQTYLAMMMAQKSFGYMKEQSEHVLLIPERLLQMLVQIKSYAEPQAASGEGSDSLTAQTPLITEDERKATQKAVDDLMTSCSEDINKLNEGTLKGEPSVNLGVTSAAQAVSEQALKAKVQMQRSFEYMKEQSESVLQVPEQMQRYAADAAESAREKAHAVSATLSEHMSHGAKKALDMAISMRLAKGTSQHGGA